MVATSYYPQRLAGTPGYLDPEYYMSRRINEKSAVYSFRIVLLEVITGQLPAIAKSSEIFIDISQWVKPMIEEGLIESIVDPKLDGNFDVNSVWKVVEIAMKCVSQNSPERPTTSQVVGELKECLELEAKRAKETCDSTGLREKPLMSICEISILPQLGEKSERKLERGGGISGRILTFMVVW
ncbi:hypothetical protein TIFTF001_018808 [Ficus carica]|uniref:Protein kinase domain-containing protein n=1 Tax=Ficus carica TaxID=3494 RepID=A0AA88AD65_FICCA|nr:hypothetical protein TIFTF001_018808 [Ficus carica]